MGLWERLPVDVRRNGEQVLWEGPTAVSSVTVIGEAAHTIDTAGADLGFLIVTTKGIVVGHQKKGLFRQRLEVWDRFEIDGIASIEDHPAGVAFQVGGSGPIDLVIAAPPRNLDGLRTATSRLKPGQGEPS